MIFNTLAIASMAFVGVCIAAYLIDVFVTSDRYIKAFTETYKKSRDQALKQVDELKKQNALLSARLDDAEKACKARETSAGLASMIRGGRDS